MSIHEKYMQRCMDLAQLGAGEVSPNPMVGSIIVHNNQIIGEGYHRKFGEAHAEVNAINQVNDEKLLSESTLYVSLEPCSHYGKTPPCAQLIIDKKIPQVVIGMKDPNEKVAGRGIDMLKRAGIKVTDNVLMDQCAYINRRFIKFHVKRKPYIILKWAQTLDGFIDIQRDSVIAQPTWITNELSQRLVHKFRSIEDTILVGTKTIINDNPTLNTRNWSGRNPTRIIIDRKLQLSKKSNVFNNDAKTIILNEIKEKKIGNMELSYFDFKVHSIEELLQQLYLKDIQSIMVEGGANTIQHFINENQWDEAHIYIGDKFFTNGVKAPQLTIQDILFKEQLNEDKLVVLNKDIKTL